MMKLLVSLVLLLPILVFCRRGVDLSVKTNIDQWTCLNKQQQVEYAIIRGYRSVGQVDTNSASTLKLASTVGIKDLSSYMFPCISTSSYSQSHGINCRPPADQVKDLLEYFSQNNLSFDSNNNSTVYLNRLWLDIEDEVPSTYFDSDPKVNVQFLQEIVKSMNDLRVPIGIYTTKTYWNTIMGNVLGFGSYPLWYPRYDGVDSLDFFPPFADFTSVQIKQTAGDSALCGISQVDTNYSED